MRWNNRSSNIVGRFAIGEWKSHYYSPGGRTWCWECRGLRSTSRRSRNCCTGPVSKKRRDFAIASSSRQPPRRTRRRCASASNYSWPSRGSVSERVVSSFPSIDLNPATSSSSSLFLPFSSLLSPFSLLSVYLQPFPSSLNAISSLCLSFELTTCALLKSGSTLNSVRVRFSSSPHSFFPFIDLSLPLFRSPLLLQLSHQLPVQFVVSELSRPGDSQLLLLLVRL